MLIYIFKKTKKKKHIKRRKKVGIDKSCELVKNKD